MSNPDFLARVEAVRNEIRTLTGNISEVGTIHQRVLSNPDQGSSAQLETIVASTQILNTKIKDQIKQLEVDAARSGRNQTKDSQIRTLKSNFKSQLEEYQKEEMAYRQRYRDQIERQYRIVNPEATDAEVREAADADWGNEGVFQTAVRLFALTKEVPTTDQFPSSNPTALVLPRVSSALSALVTTTFRRLKRPSLS